MPVKLGVARVDITPPVGIAMVGFAGRDDADDVHDPLTATALGCVADDGPAVMVALDLLGLRAETVAEFRQAVAAAADVHPNRVILACAHNHYGPAVDRSTDAPLVAAYRENLKHLVAGVARQALAHVRPARLGVGSGASDIGINRRERRADGQVVLGQNPAGPIDREVGVARIDDADGRPMATVVNFACHPVCQGGQMRSLSADYVGRTRTVVEALTGAPCLFLQGACGNVNPVLMIHAYEPARTLGTRLGCEVVRVRETLTPSEVGRLVLRQRRIGLPRYRHGNAGQAAALEAELEREVATLSQPGASPGQRWWAEHRLARIAEVVRSWRTGEALSPVEAEVQAWRLGDLALTTAPGEVFCEIGARVKERAPAPHAFYAAYANGYMGYVPVRAAYAEGGYEVTHACQVDPEAGEQLEQAALELLAEVTH
jgi:hypothetical protein